MAKVFTLERAGLNSVHPGWQAIHLLQHATKLGSIPTLAYTTAHNRLKVIGA